MNITKPTLVINEQKVRKNIKTFVEKSRRNNIRFRPHFKTHQSETIGSWFKEYGVSAITVSSVDMAEYFVKAGWQDITIAFPVNLRQLDTIHNLANICQLGLLVDSVESASFLARKIEFPLSVWIEIDQGYHRTGVQDENTLIEIANAIDKSSSIKLVGLLTHAGHAYSAQSTTELKQIHIASIRDLQDKQNILRTQGYNDCQLSIGDTPTCSIANDFTGVDEIRPGSFVFYDLEQLALGACTESELAMGVACPVVAKYPDRNQLIIYGGAVHLSKEYQELSSGENSFGKVTYFMESSWSPVLEKVYVKSISQEHGIIQATPEVVGQVQVGDVLFIYPVHSCLTANLFSNFQTLTNKKISKMQSLLPMSYE